MKNKFIIISILIMSMLFFVACSDIDESQESETDALIESAEVGSENVIEEESVQNDKSSTDDDFIETETHTDEESEKQASPLDDISFFISDARNDSTGNWSVCAIAEELNIKDYAVDYYETYFESNDETHGIVNFNYNTTTKILVVGDSLNVSVYEYVDKEEHDANIMFSGMLLDEYYINITDGTIERSQ